MIQRLSSLQLTFGSLKGLCLLLALGVVLAYSPVYGPGIRAMSEGLVLDWIFQQGGRYPLLVAWFGIILGISILLFVNLAACVFKRIQDLAGNGLRMRQILFILLHIAFGLVMVCHGTGLGVGFKHSNVELGPGEAFDFAPDWRLVFEKAVFVDDPKMLRMGFKKARAMMTRERFHRRKNRATLSLLRNGELLGRGEAASLEPFKCGDIQIALTRFTISSDGQVGAFLVITRNPFVGFFFASYLLLILLLIGYTVFTWRLPPPRKNGKERI